MVGKRESLAILVRFIVQQKLKGGRIGNHGENTLQIKYRQKKETGSYMNLLIQ